MDMMEISEKERLSRQGAAARLHSPADARTRHNDVEFDRSDIHSKVRVAHQVDLKPESDDKKELEVQLKW
jgi:hypothetical protein